MALRFAEGSLHLHGIAVTFPGVELNRGLQNLGKLRPNPRGQFVMTLQWPFEGPFGKPTRQQSVNDKPERKHVRLKFRPAHRLFGRYVIDRSRARGFQCTKIQFREPEVGQLQLVVRKQNEILWLDVAMNDLVLMSMRHRSQCLTGQVEGSCCRSSTFNPVRQRFNAKFHRNNKTIPDVARIHHRQNVRMLEFRRYLHLMKKFRMPRLAVTFRDL